MGISFFFSFVFCFSSFHSYCKASSDSHFAFLHFFFLGMVLIPVSCTMSRTSIHSSSGTLSVRSSPDRGLNFIPRTMKSHRVLLSKWSVLRECSGMIWFIFLKKSDVLKCNLCTTNFNFLKFEIWWVWKILQLHSCYYIQNNNYSSSQKFLLCFFSINHLSTLPGPDNHVFTFLRLFRISYKL